MLKSGIDQDALIEMFSTTSARQTAQLRDAVGSADRATLLATAALALNQVDRVIRAVREADGRVSEPPPTLNTTLEFDVSTGATVSRRWSKHPRCDC